MIESGQARRVLFLTGETYSKLLHQSDKSTRTLFGDAGSATLVEATDGNEERIGPFVYGSDGSGGEHLIVRRGGFRLPGAPVDDENWTADERRRDICVQCARSFQSSPVASVAL